MKYLILTPVYNDWASLKYLLQKIDFFFKKKNLFSEIIIVDDKSNKQLPLNIKIFNNIKKINLIYLKKNMGNQKAIFIGLKYIEKKIKSNSIITIMDSDGEDDPSKIFNLIEKTKEDENYIVVANRKKRNETLMLQLLNKIRLAITFILTGKYINFGNFSSFHNKNLKKILKNENLWHAYSSGMIVNTNKIIEININKKKRYFGKSKANFSFLTYHSLNIINVFKQRILLRSFIFLLLIYLLNNTMALTVSFLIFLILNAFNYIFYNKNSLKINPINLINKVNILKN